MAGRPTRCPMPRDLQAGGYGVHVIFGPCRLSLYSFCDLCGSCVMFHGQRKQILGRMDNFYEEDGGIINDIL